MTEDGLRNALHLLAHIGCRTHAIKWLEQGSQTALPPTAAPLIRYSRSF
jgi:hypothetical protein